MASVFFLTKTNAHSNKFLPTQRNLKDLAAQVHSARPNLSTLMYARHWLKRMVILN